jgi:hypothetical protein
MTLEMLRKINCSDPGYAMRAPLHVVYADPGGPGYHCVYYMARLAAQLLNAQLIVVRHRNIALIRTLMCILPRSDHGVHCLLICPSPVDLSAILQITNWRRKYRVLIAWVFDSFWPEYIPRFAHWTRVFDQVCVTEQEDLDTWRRMMHTPVEWLPWGSDVLRLGSDNPSRHFDLLRFGRQPSEWADDSTNSSQCDSRGLIFQGRPPELEDATDSELSLMNFLGKTKFTLAFSNLVNPNPQTHPVREYLTGRWTDALAAGAVVAGVPPRSGTVRSLLWPEALLDLGTVNQGEGLEVITNAVRDWTPARARLNYLRSLERLDWRWRFKRLTEFLGIHSDQLDKELTDLRRVLDSDRTPMPASQPPIC